MNSKTDRQRLETFAQVGSIRRMHVESFAYGAAVTIHRGHLYRFAQRLGIYPLEICTELGRDLQHLNRVGDLADTYKRRDITEFQNATWLAMASYELSLQAVAASIESDEMMLQTLGSTDRFANALADWRRRMAASDPPPLDSVILQLEHLLGHVIDKYDLRDINLDLGDALALGGDLTGIGNVVFGFRGTLMTPEVCRVLAETAMEVAYKPSNQHPPGTIPD